MGGIVSDFRHAVRGLAKTPTFTAVVVAVMALGISVNTVIFSAVNAILLRGLPFPEPSRVLSVSGHDLHTGFDRMELSFPDYRDLAERARSIAAWGAYYESQAYLTLGTEPERFESAAVTPSLFPTLGIPPRLGRGFLPEEGENGNQWGSVILSHRVWAGRLESDPGVLGRGFKINGRVRTVVGVMPEGFRFPESADFWIPIAYDPAQHPRDGQLLDAVARLAHGATLDEARTELAAIGAALAAEHPDDHHDWTLVAAPLHETLVREVRPSMLMLMSAVVFVLLIACANVANLMLARSMTRVRELGLRVALGASRMRLARLLLCEAVVISLAGAGLGVLLALWGLELVLAAIPIDLAYWMRIEVDARVLAFTAGIAVFSGILFGLAPVAQATRANLADVLKEGGAQSGASRSQGRIRAGLVVAEVALALVLLAGAGLMVRSFLHMQDIRQELDPEGVLTGRITLPVAVYPSDSARAAFVAELLPRLRALPGVREAGGIVNLPLGHDSWNTSVTRESDAAADADGRGPRAVFAPITVGGLEALGVSLRAGRLFTPDDRLGRLPVALVNESAARRLWPGREAIGRRLRTGGSTEWRVVVGVVADVRQLAHVEHLRETVYVPHAQDPVQSLTLVLRSAADPASLARGVRTLLQQRDRDLPLYDVRTLRASVAYAVWEPRLYAALMTVFGLIALVIAAVGLYGVMAYSVEQRTREIGIRMALGAAQSAVVRMVVGQGLRLTVIGLGIGLAAAFGITRLMAGMLFGVSASDPPTYLGVVAILAASALLASWLPAHRATRVEVMTALRQD